MESQIMKMEISTLEREKKRLRLKPHKDFISIHPNVNSISNILFYVGDALQNQHLFQRYTTPWEERKQGQGQDIINLEELDRLYYIYDTGCFHASVIRCSVLLGRLDGLEGKTYVGMKSFHYNSDKGWCGLIYLTRDPMIFFNLISQCWYLTEKTSILDRVKQSLKADDNIDVYYMPSSTTTTTTTTTRFLSFVKRRLLPLLPLSLYGKEKRDKANRKQLLDSAISYFKLLLAVRYSSVGPYFLSLSRKKLSY